MTLTTTDLTRLLTITLEQLERVTAVARALLAQKRQAEAIARTLQAQRDEAEKDMLALRTAARAYLDCHCAHGVHWVDVEGEAEAEACELRIELDDLLRDMEARTE